MKLSELLTTYWSQVLLLLLGIGYILRRLLDDRSKRHEINHSIYQKCKLDAIRNFFLHYEDAKSMWYNLKIFQIFQGKLEPDEIDSIIFPPLNRLRSIRSELGIYFKIEVFLLFDQLTDSMYDINVILQEYFVDFENKYKDKTLIQRVNDFRRLRDGIFTQNDEYIKSINEEIRKNYTKAN